jgi:poly-gamma-glutamate synthesis protein (capsule biosynthesis protein)
VGILGYSWRPVQYGNSLPPYADANIDGVVADVSRLRSECDTVIVSLHWGDEFAEQPSASDVQNAKRIVEAGASLIVGHHPHVLRPLAKQGGAIVAFSLGNFASDMLWLDDTRTGAMLWASFGPNGCRDVAVQRLRTDSEYKVAPIDGGMPELVEGGLDAQRYSKQVRQGLARQRWHAYRYAFRNIRRPPFPVLLELVSRTVLNKLVGLWR